jgi:gentisate 1,2-dioxygenase
VTETNTNLTDRMAQNITTRTARESADDEAIRKCWDELSISPLWESAAAHKPADAFDAPHLWRWDELRPQMERALRMASPAAVERRVLQLISPESRAAGHPATVKNLVAGLQGLRPGESARPHRHSLNALRFVLEGRGAVTIVDGKHCPMEMGDLVLTPGWCWHEHVHRGTEPAIWLDALDAPFHRYLGTARFEAGPVKNAPIVVPDSSFAVANIVPEIVAPLGNHSPVFRYPYTSALAALSAAPIARDGARRVRYVNPVTGGAVMTLLDSTLMQLDPNVLTGAVRSTSNAVVTVVEGHGESTIGSKTFAWSPRDIFTVPQGNWATHHSNKDGARLFVFSDRQIFARLGLLEEEYADG